MAGTDQAARLTEVYRRDQLKLRARALREVAPLWKVVDVANLSMGIGAFAQSAAGILVGFANESALGTLAYLGLFRDAEEVAGSMRYRPGTAPTVQEAAGLVRGAALSGIIDARKAGRSMTAAKSNGLVKALGDVGKLVLNGGRSTIVRAAEEDPEAKGFERQTSLSACYFCLMLASRGPVYKSARSSSFEAHGHCACTGELVFVADSDSGPLREEWLEVTAGLSGAAARNAWRRHVEAERAAGAPLG